MSTSSFLEQLGSVKSEWKFRLSKNLLPHVDATILVLSCIRTVPCEVSTLRPRSILTLLAVQKRGLGQCLCARVLCARQLLLQRCRLQGD